MQPAMSRATYKMRMPLCAAKDVQVSIKNRCINKMHSLIFSSVLLLLLQQFLARYFCIWSEMRSCSFTNVQICFLLLLFRSFFFGFFPIASSFYSWAVCLHTRPICNGINSIVKMRVRDSVCQRTCWVHFLWICNDILSVRCLCLVYGHNISTKCNNLLTLLLFHSLHDFFVCFILRIFMMLHVDNELTIH